MADASLIAPTPSGGSGAHRAPHAQRYAMRFDDEVMCMEEADEGGYVSFDDYETLRQQYDVTAAALLAARRGEEDAQRTLEDIERSLESAGINDENEAGDFMDLPTRVDLLVDERDHLAFKVGQLAARAATPEGP